MLFKTLAKTETLEVDGREYTVRYFEGTTARGTKRHCAELVLAPDDRIILDAATLSDLELRVARMMPAMLQSRMLVA